ncbi:MAG: nucleoid-structuring protein H-NS [Verrucomicrobiales bacterium]|nr:nucleoid-structuring protein H-NS [Verrucomicrobiales bacterium]
MTESKENAPWVTFRPEIKVLDCTVRDGGLINAHKFEDDFVKAVYDTAIAAGIDYMELGYKASKTQFARADHGDWKYCNEDDLRRIVGDNDTPLKLTAMADAGKTDYKTDILPADQSVLDCIRVATYAHQIPTAVDMIRDAYDKGYETCCNIMAISTVADSEIDKALETLAETPVETVVVVDSYGALYHEQIRELVKKYVTMAKATGKEVGIHTHNNMQLAFANTIEAIIQGANRIDATMLGLGRGAGNCPMELLLGFLKNPKFDLRPIFKLLQDHLMPLRRTKEWGALIPYVITGILNQHPRAAMRVRDTEEKNQFLAFYDACTAEV